VLLEPKFRHRGLIRPRQILIKLIDNVLTIPPPIPGVLAGAASSSALVSVVSSIAPDLVSALNTTAGLTVFAPTDEAVAAAQDAITQVAGTDPAAVTSVIQGHVLNQVVYSSQSQPYLPH
jgi:uncharacterized surface protein with fasciclin (FAS1) repeats